MTHPKPRIWLVTVNFNSAAYIDLLLRSLDIDALAGVVIVDNASSDTEESETLTRLASAFPRVNVVRSQENLGFGGGVNLGVRSIDEDWTHVWVVNPDTVARPNAVAVLTNWVAREPSAEIVSPRILRSGTARVWFDGGDIDLRRGATVHWRFDQDPTPAHAPFDTAFVSGAAPLFSLSAWNLLGGFREDLFLYWEDADLSLRAKQLGIAMRVVPDAVIEHVEGGSSDSRGRSVHYYRFMQRNRMRVCSQYASRLQLLAGAGVLEWMRLLVRPIREPDGRARKMAASLRGLAEGAALALREGRT